MGAAASFGCTEVEQELSSDLRTLQEDRLVVQLRRQAIVKELALLAVQEAAIDAAISRSVEGLLTVSRQRAAADALTMSALSSACGMFEARGAPGYAIYDGGATAERAGGRSGEYAAAVCDGLMRPDTGVHRWVMRISRDCGGAAANSDDAGGGAPNVRRGGWRVRRGSFVSKSATGAFQEATSAEAVEAARMEAAALALAAGGGGGGGSGVDAAVSSQAAVASAKAAVDSTRTPGSIIFGVCDEALPVGTTAATHTSSQAVGFVCSNAGSVRGKIGDATLILVRACAGEACRIFERARRRFASTMRTHVSTRVPLSSLVSLSLSYNSLSFLRIPLPSLFVIFS